MKLILHVGQPKTGTTSIQNLLQMNSDLLKESGFLYKSNALNHQPIIQNIMQQNDVDAALLDFVKEQKLNANKHKCHTIILSSEAFFELEIEFLRKLINLFNMETTVIVHLKRQDLFLESSWKQWHFKNKHYRNFDDYVGRSGLKDYSLTLEKWSQLVGQENIYVTPFEKKNFPNGLLKHFLSLVGVTNEIEEQMNFNIPKTMFGTNQGLSPKGLKFAFLVRELAEDPLDYTIENFIHKYLGDVFHKEHFEDYGLFSYEKRKKYLERWKESNTSIAQKYLNRDFLFEDEITEDKKNIDITLDDMAKVIMSMGIKFDQRLNKLNR